MDFPYDEAKQIARDLTMLRLQQQDTKDIPAKELAALYQEIYQKILDEIHPSSHEKRFSF